MKKLVSWLLMLMLCILVAAPVSAANGFTESVPDKDAPDLVTEEDEEGHIWIGEVNNTEGEAVSRVEEKCLVITSVAKLGEAGEITEEAAEKLAMVYQGLTDGTMEIPYEEWGLDPESMVIRDLFDVSWSCDDHPDLVAPEGVVVVLTFDLGIAPDETVYAAAYKNEQWSQIVQCTNNGDGTVTGVFENFCPVAFMTSVTVADLEVPATGDTMGSDMMVWVAVMGVAVVAMVVFLVLRRKSIRG